MTDEEKELLKTGVEAALRPFSNVIGKLFGGAAEELGGMWQDSLRVRRLARQVKLLGKVERIISDARFEPHQIADNIWMPAWLYASMEDEDDLQERWAALLANASRPESPSTVSPSFAEILHQLRPNEAKFLDALYDGAGGRLKLPRVRTNAAETGQFSIDDLQDVYRQRGLTTIEFNMTAGQHERSDKKVVDQEVSVFKMAVDNLLRLRLLARERNVAFDKNMYKRDFANLPFSMKYYDRYSLTALGGNFVEACRRPEPEPAAGT